MNDLKTWHKIFYMQALLEASLIDFGDQLAAKHEYKSVTGIEAIRFHLMQTHHWTPTVVNALSIAEIRFAIGEELEDHKLSPELKAIADQMESQPT